MPKVMIIDDDRTMVTLLQTLLQLDGFEVLATFPRDDVLSEIGNNRPDLVLMDVFLTGADGIELLKKLRASPDLCSVPVVMASGMDLSDRCAEAGANGFLLKPYTPEQLISLIRETLNAAAGSRAASL